MPTNPPNRQDLNSALLWLARLKLGDGELYRGPVEIQISAPRIGEKQIISAVRGCDGLALPVVALAVVPAGTPSGSELIKVLLSENEKAILRAVWNNPKSLVKIIQKAAKVGSGFYTLWNNLKSRGLVVSVDQGKGYVLGVSWITAVTLEPGLISGVRLAAEQE